jgi:hypothetical protein
MKRGFARKEKYFLCNNLVKIFYQKRSFSLIDGFTKVTDKDAAVYTQNFEEGILLVILLALR